MLSIPWAYIQVDNRTKESGSKRCSPASIRRQACVWCLRPELAFSMPGGALAAMPPCPRTSLPKSCRSKSPCTGLNEGSRFREAPVCSYYLWNIWEFSSKESRCQNSCFLGLIAYCWWPCHQMSVRWGINYLLWCQQLLIRRRLDFPRLPSCEMWHLCMYYFQHAPGNVR